MRGTPPFGGFYENSVPIFQRKTVTVEHMDMIPIGCITAKILHSLADKLVKLEHWQRQIGGPRKDLPCLRLLQGGRDGRITALVQSGTMTLKLALRKGEEWVVLGDALKISD
jgi:hypothetical protein